MSSKNQIVHAPFTCDQYVLKKKFTTLNSTNKVMTLISFSNQLSSTLALCQLFQHCSFYWFFNSCKTWSRTDTHRSPAKIHLLSAHFPFDCLQAHYLNQFQPSHCVPQTIKMAGHNQNKRCHVYVFRASLQIVLFCR